MRTNPSSSVTPTFPPRPPRRRGLWILGPVLATLALGGASISAAHAQVQEGAQEQAIDPTDAGAMAGGLMARRMERLLDKVGATASQRRQIEGIWNGLRPQLKALHQQHGAVRRQIVGALTAATISPPAVEQLRQQSMGFAEKTSSLLTQGFVQTAQVLTPDQRKQVQSILSQERGRFHHGHGPEQP